MKNLIVLIGPTGVGKTECCLQIAKEWNIPVINADSRQIYAEIPIGTAAPTPEQQKLVKHLFVGTHSIHDYYSAAKYEEDALQAIALQHQQHNLALLSGGSMLYIDAVCKGIDDIPTVDDKIRNKVKEDLAQEGLPALLEKLKQLDPEHYHIVDKNNPRRVCHALEICYTTGKTYTSFRTSTIKTRSFNIIKIGLTRDRQQLYDRINKRVEQMMQNGLLEEAHKLFPYRHLNALNTVGYKELFRYFDGEIPLQEAVRQIQSHTREYMRKQQTWFKKDEQIRWFHPDNLEEVINYIHSSI